MGTEHWGRYVAVGDSFTEGLWDTDPRRPDWLRGWADRLAASLSARRRAAGEPPVEYANLAIRGRLLGAIIREQVPAALQLRPDLVSLVGGGNDVLRPTVDVDALAADIEDAVARLRAQGVDVLLATGVDSAGSPLIKATRGRVALLNTHVWSIARRHGAYVLDVWGMRCLRDWRMWSEDRIHLTGEGHARVAQGALVGLGLGPDTPDWDDPLAAIPDPAAGERLRWNLSWLRHHVYPWATRRLRGRSTGADRHAKRPEIAPLDDGPVPGEAPQAPGVDHASSESRHDGARTHDNEHSTFVGEPEGRPTARAATSAPREPTERTDR